MAQMSDAIKARVNDLARTIANLPPGGSSAVRTEWIANHIMMLCVGLTPVPSPVLKIATAHLDEDLRKFRVAAEAALKFSDTFHAWSSNRPGVTFQELSQSRNAMMLALRDAGVRPDPAPKGTPHRTTCDGHIPGAACEQGLPFVETDRPPPPTCPICPRCGGSGNEPGTQHSESGTLPCFKCNGTGSGH